MSRTKPKTSLAQSEFSSLSEKYKNFIEQLQKRWLRYHNPPPKGWRLYELDAEERQRVNGVIHNWERYVTPIAEKWWKRRGFGIRWPVKSSNPCQFYKLEVAQG